MRKIIALVFSCILFIGCSTKDVETSTDLEQSLTKLGYNDDEVSSLLEEVSSLLEEVDKHEDLGFEESAFVYLTEGGYSSQKATQIIDSALENNSIDKSEHDTLLLEIALDYGIMRFEESSPDFILKRNDIRAITHKDTLDDFGYDSYHRWTVIQREGMEYKNRNTTYSFIWNGIDIVDGKPVVKDIYLDIKGERFIDNLSEYNENKNSFYP